MLSQHVTSAPKSAQRLVRTWQWFHLLFETGAWQAAIAAVGFASGIAIVRLLDVEQYALYTIANSLLGAMIVLGDSGISSGVMSQGGAVWQDKDRLGSVVSTALRLCRLFAIAAAVLAIPVAVYLLNKHGAPVVLSLGIAAVLVPSFVVAVRNNVLQIPLRLNQDLRPLQRIQLGANVARFFLLGGALSLAPFALAALVAAATATSLANVYLVRRAEVYSSAAAPADPAMRKAIMQIVWRTLPGSTYYAMLGQVTVWLLSIFGNTDSIAQLGALGRLAMITSVASAVTATLLVPRFARLPNDRPLLLRRFVFMTLGMGALCLLGIGLVTLFPRQILWVLGSNYGNLETELVLVALTAATTLLGGLCVSLSFARGIVPNPLVLIPYSLATYALFIAFNDVSTLRGVLLMGLGTTCCQLVFNAIYLMLRAGRRQPH
jgi:O-antigen/teichoic acid export membrane protein